MAEPENARASEPAPLASVVVPTYQRRELIAKAIASALAQTFRDFELIVVDDGSTDGTEAVVKGLGDARIRYVWQENRGVSAARNTGIRAARGRVVALLDSDDPWLPDHLAIVTEVLERNPEAILCTTSPRFEIGGREEPGEAKLVDALPALLVENIVGAPGSVVIRRDALLAVNGFDERLRVMEGWELWLRLSLVGKFALLQRRTIIVQSIQGSLTARSAQNGEYLRALRTIRGSVEDLAGRMEGRADRDLLISRARGLVAYLDALGAIGSEDRETARAKLVAACAGLPALSIEPQLVANRLSLLRFGREARLRSFGMAADQWPDRRADTPMYLRFHAMLLAIRLGRGKEAMRLAGGWPLLATPGFLIRRAALFAQLARRTLQKRLHRGTESSAMPDSPRIP